MLLARQKIAQNLLALGVADLLQDHLLRSLRADPSHLHALDGFLDVFADLDVRIDLHRLVQLVFPRGHLDIGIVDDQPAPEKRKLTCDGIDGRPDINVLIEALVADASASSSAPMTMFLSTFFSRANASISNNNSRLISALNS